MEPSQDDGSPTAMLSPAGPGGGKGSKSPLHIYSSQCLLLLHFRIKGLLYFPTWLRSLLSYTSILNDLVANEITGYVLTSYCHCCIIGIINWVGQALNADWRKAVVYQTVYYGYDKTSICTTNYVGNQFIIAIRHLGGLWYMANTLRLRVES